MALGEFSVRGIGEEMIEEKRQVSDFPEYGRVLAAGLQQMPQYIGAVAARFKRVREQDAEVIGKMLSVVGMLSEATSRNRQSLILNVFDAVFDHALLSRPLVIARCEHLGSVVAGPGGFGIRRFHRTDYGAVDFNWLMRMQKEKKAIVDALTAAGKVKDAAKFGKFCDLMLVDGNSYVFTDDAVDFTLRSPVLFLNGDAINVIESIAFDGRMMNRPYGGRDHSSKGDIVLNMSRFDSGTGSEAVLAIDFDNMTLDDSFKNAFVYLQLRDELQGRIDEMVDVVQRRLKTGDDIIAALRAVFAAELLVAGV